MSAKSELREGPARSDWWPSASVLRIVHGAVCIFGFGLCLVAYYPGLLSPDSLGMMLQARSISFFDWHSTMMPLIWAVLYRIGRGPQSMMVLLLVLYWGALFVLAQAAARIERRVAAAMLVMGFMPFTINFVGTLWTDVLLATSWLMCAALVFSGQTSGQPTSMLNIWQAAAWILFLIGALTRANALFAAIPLGLYLWQPQRPLPPVKRALVAALLLMGVWLANGTLSYPILNSKKTYAIHSIVTYDLGGISHFSGRNYLPAHWTADETAKIISSCYTPQAWNEYAWGECKFVWRRLRDEGLWGSSALWRAWFDAVTAEPVAYLRHRFGHFWYFISTVEYVFHEGITPEEVQQRLEHNFAFWLMRNYVVRSQRLLAFHPLFWLALAGGCLVAARRCPPVSRRFVSTLSLSSLAYLGTYLFAGVASNFRYAYWAVLATSASTVVLACEGMAAWARRRRAAAVD